MGVSKSFPTSIPTPTPTPTNRGPETGFFYENTPSQPTDSVKNPVSLVGVSKSFPTSIPTPTPTPTGFLTKILHRSRQIR
ncbi:MAG: hypothetical protein EAZ09_22695 [Oscillatoriales cyanobacterium]|nr:MAG: hypothetical protein EAZ09_22695 [Oscillatoriales cyanobacterium]